MNERESLDARATEPVETSSDQHPAPVGGSAVASSGTAQPVLAPSMAHEPAAPAWALPSPANAMPAPGPGEHRPGAAEPVTQAIDAGPVEAGSAASPADSSGPHVASGTPLLRRKTLVGAAGAGAAVLLAGAGFLAGTQFGHERGDTTRLVSDQSGPSGGGYGSPFGQGGQGGQGMPGGRLPDGDGDGDGGRGFGGRDGAGVGSIVAAGQITAVGKAELTLRTFQGATATVSVTSSTTVDGTAGGDLSSLKVGQVVLVAGTRTGSGAYRATSIVTPPDRAGAAGQHGQSGQQGQSDQAGGTGGVGGAEGRT